MRRKERIALVLGVVAAVSVAAPVWAQAPVGIVLEASGSIRPAVRPYTEIPPDTTLALTGGARVVFLHYQTCRTVALVGGSVTLTAPTYLITGGNKESEARTACPRKVNVRGGELGGAVYRSMPGRGGLTLAPEAAFVLAGSKAGEFSTARITRDDAPVVEGPIKDGVFQWPAGATPLGSNAAYELTLVPSRAGEKPVTIRFATPASAAPAGTEPLVVIGVD